ncbi:MAG: PAS domain S-box protein [Myxococcales bacterium]|nr:PAS domain S-box protein [Myxococcales bacterium]
MDERDGSKGPRPRDDGGDRYRDVFESAGIGMALVSLAGRFLAVNRSFCGIVRRSEATLLACDFQSITHPDDLASDLDLVSSLLRGERDSYQIEKRYILEDGDVVWVMLTGSLIRDGEGRPLHFIAQIVDISTRRRTEAELRASEDRYRALVEAADDPIASFDDEGRFMLANAATAALMGRAPADLVGRRLVDLLPPERAAQRMRDLRIALQQGRTHEVESEYVAANGPRVLQTKLIPLQDAGGAWSRVIALGRDITALRRLTAERQALAERVEKVQRLESLSLMAGGVAHDLNNLLTAVLAHADCARLDAPPNSDLAESLDQIADATRRAAELTAQLDAVSGKTTRRVAVVELPALARDTAALLRPTLPRSCAVRLALEPAAVEGDPAQLRQIVLNLVINAAQAISGAGEIVIRTGTRDVGSPAVDPLEPPPGRYAFIAVADDGCGMTAEVQRRVFEPFFTTKPQGRGLGLAVVHGVARGHQGGVRLRSAPGGGTEIEVLLPAHMSASASVAEPGEAVEAASPARGVILVVDDERAVRDSLRRSLRRLGHDVVAFETGVAALGYFRREPDAVALVVLDLQMPGMDGVEVLRALRAIRADVRVVISSGYGGPLELRDVPGGDRVRYLSKPYGIHELQVMLRELLAG